MATFGVGLRDAGCIGLLALVGSYARFAKKPHNNTGALFPIACSGLIRRHQNKREKVYYWGTSYNASIMLYALVHFETTMHGPSSF